MHQKYLLYTSLQGGREMGVWLGGGGGWHQPPCPLLPPLFPGANIFSHVKLENIKFLHANNTIKPNSIC